MTGPGCLFRLLAAAGAAGLCALPAWAEGRNDPFLACTFGDVRVTLAENGDAVQWHEAGATHEARCFGQGGAAAVCVADTAPPRVLTLATGTGTALLTVPELAGGLTLSERMGQCQSLVP